MYDGLASLCMALPVASLSMARCPTLHASALHLPVSASAEPHYSNCHHSATHCALVRNVALIWLRYPVQYPKTSAAIGAAYIASTIAYFVAYAKDPKKRMYPFVARNIGLAALCGMCVRVGAKALPEHVFNGGNSSNGGDSGYAGRR